MLSGGSRRMTDYFEELPLACSEDEWCEDCEAETEFEQDAVQKPAPYPAGQPREEVHWYCTVCGTKLPEYEL